MIRTLLALLALALAGLAAPAPARAASKPLDFGAFCQRVRPGSTARAGGQLNLTYASRFECVGPGEASVSVEVPYACAEVYGPDWTAWRTSRLWPFGYVCAERRDLYSAQEAARVSRFDVANPAGYVREIRDRIGDAAAFPTLFADPEVRLWRSFAGGLGEGVYGWDRLDAKLAEKGLSRAQIARFDKDIAALVRDGRTSREAEALIVDNLIDDSCRTPAFAEALPLIQGAVRDLYALSGATQARATIYAILPDNMNRRFQRTLMDTMTKANFAGTPGSAVPTRGGGVYVVKSYRPFTCSDTGAALLAFHSPKPLGNSVVTLGLMTYPQQDRESSLLLYEASIYHELMHAVGLGDEIVRYLETCFAAYSPLSYTSGPLPHYQRQAVFDRCHGVSGADRVGAYGRLALTRNSQDDPVPFFEAELAKGGLPQKAEAVLGLADWYEMRGDAARAQATRVAGAETLKAAGLADCTTIGPGERAWCLFTPNRPYDDAQAVAWSRLGVWRSPPLPCCRLTH